MKQCSIIEYDDKTQVEFKVNGEYIVYSFESWDEAIEALPELNPEGE